MVFKLKDLSSSRRVTRVRLKSRKNDFLEIFIIKMGIAVSFIGLLEQMLFPELQDLNVSLTKPEEVGIIIPKIDEKVKPQPSADLGLNADLEWFAVLAQGAKPVWLGVSKAEIAIVSEDRSKVIEKIKREGFNIVSSTSMGYIRVNL